MTRSLLRIFLPLLWLGSVFSVQAQSADLVFSPNAVTAALNDVFVVAVNVEAGSTPIDAAGVALNFDNSLLEVVSLSTVGSPLPVPVITTFDNGQGTIDVNQGTFSNFPSGTFLLVNIEFRVIGTLPMEGTQVTHDLTSPPPFSDVTSAGMSVLNQAFDLSVNPPVVPNVPPTISGIGDQSNEEGDVVNLDISGFAADSDGSVVDFNVVGGSLPGGLSLSSAGLISGTIDVGAAAGSVYSITVEVTDDDGDLSNPDATFNWTVTVPNQAPIVVVVSPEEGSSFGSTTFQDVRFPSGSNIPLTVNATDADGSIVSVEFFDGGGSLGFGTASGGGDFTASLNNASVGSFQFSATAFDDDGASGSSSNSDQITVFPRTKSIPGLIEAEDFISRTPAIIVQANGPTEPAGLHVGGIENNSLTEYDVEVGTNTLTYDVVVRAASNNNGGTITFRDGAANVLGTINIPGTDGWQSYQDFSTQVTFLSSGSQQLFMDYTGTSFLFNLNWVEFTEVIPNLPPTISAIPDQTNQEGDVVNLDLSAFANDSDGTVVSYALAVGSDPLPDGLSLNANTGLINGTINAGAAVASPYSLSVEVTDDDGDSSDPDDDFTWTVTVPNNPPAVAIVGPEITGSGGMIDYASVRFPSGSNFDLVANATDSDGSISSVDFDENGGGSLGTGAASGGDNYNLTINNAPVGSFEFTATATDNLGASTTSALSDEITVFERTKAIPGIVETEDFLSRSSAIKVQVNGGTDAPGFHIGFIQNGSQTSYEVNVTSAGVYDVLVRAASDQTGGLITFKDGGGSTLGTVNVSNTTGWQTYQDFTGQVTFTTAGVQTLELEYSAGGSFLFNLNRVEFSTFIPNQPPTIADIPDQQDEEGDVVSLDLSTFAADSDGNVVSYALAAGSDALPNGLSLNASTGLINGTILAGAAAASPYTIIIEVTDNEGASSDPDDTFVWMVSEPPNQLPTISGIPDQIDTEGDVVSLDLSAFANDADGLLVDFALANGSDPLPDGLSLNAATGLISGTLTATAAANSPYFLIIEVTDDDGDKSNPDDDFNWTVSPAVNNPPMITTVATQEIDAGTTLNLGITVVDEQAPTVSIEIYDISIVGTNNPFTPGGTVPPADYSFTDNMDGTYTLIWPTDASDGRAYEARVTADDGVNTPVTEAFDINVAQAVPGTVQSNTLKNPKPWYVGSPGAGFTVTMENTAATNMGFIDNGDVLDYLINVPTAGTYDLLLRLAKGNNSGPGGITTVTFSEESGGGFSTLGSVGVPGPANNPGGGWQNYFDYTTQITFSNSGLQTVRLSFNAGANVDFFTISPATNVSPVISLMPVGDQSMQINQSLTVQLDVSDSDGDISGNTTVNGPAFMSVNSSTNTANSYQADLEFNPGPMDAGVYTIDISTNDGINPAVTASFQLVVSEPLAACDLKYRVNAGGPLVTASDGDDFEADTGGSPNQYLVQGGDVFSITRPITNTTGYPASLFQTERYQVEGDLEYAFPVVTGGEYEVRLLFAEIWNQENANPGNNRIFDIFLDGTLVEDNFRPFEAAGNMIDVTVVQSYTVTAPDALLNILLSPENQNPALKGIEICTISEPAQSFVITASAGPMGTITPNGAVTVAAGADQTFNIMATPGFVISDVLVDGVSVGPVSSYTFSNVQADATISASFTFAPTFTITATAGAGGSISPSGAVSVVQGADQSFTITADPGFLIEDVLVDGVSVGALATYEFIDVQANATITASFIAAPFEPIYINVGGPAYTSQAGIDFAADNGEFNGTVFPTSSGQINTLNNTDFFNTEDDVLFRSERFAMTLNGAFNVPNGDYVVDLYLAEIFQGVLGGGTALPNERVFDILLEGNLVQDDLDLLDPDRGGSFAPATGIIKSFVVSVVDGVLDVSLVKSIDNAKIAAICIRPAGTANGAPEINPIADVTACAGQTASAGVTASDDVMVTEFQLQLTDSNGDLVPENEYNFASTGGLASFTWATDVADVGMYTATVLAYDGFDVSAAATFSINILSNTPPTVVINAPADGASVMRASPINFLAAASDAEDGDLTASIVWSSPDDASFTGTGGNLNAQLLGLGGTYTITATITDACGATGSASISLEVPVPEVSFVSPTDNQIFGAYSIPVEVLPLGLDLNANGGGEHFHFYLNPADPNNPDFNERISTASQPGITTFTFDQSTMTTGTGQDMLLDPGDNTLVVIAAESNHTEFQNPEARDIVIFFIGNTIVATAGAGGSISPLGTVLVPLGADQSFTISPDPGFMISDVLVDGVSVGAVLDFEFLDVQADATIEAFFLPVGPASADFIFDPNPEDVVLNEVFSVDLNVAAGFAAIDGAEAHLTFDPTLLEVVSITTAASPLPVPIISPTFNNTNGTIDLASGTFSNFPSGTFLFCTIEFRVLAALPPGGTLVEHTRSGFPVSQITSMLTDILNASPALQINPEAGENLAPTVSGIPDQTNLEGDLVNLDLSAFATDVDGMVVDYAIVGGTLPAGLSLSAGSGLISGTVATSAAAGSPYIITIEVTDDDGATSTPDDVFIWTVNAPATPEVYVAIDPSTGNINSASTFNNGFIITNNSSPGVQITSVTFDLSTAFYPGNVFDPVGTAGDATAKCVTIVAGSDPVGLTIPGNGGSGADPDCTTPFSQPRGNGGFDRMTLVFNDFDPTETLNIAVDVDPVSIEGFAAAGNAGAVSGLELIGTTVFVTFSDGSVYQGETYRIQPNSVKGSENTLKTNIACAAPDLNMAGLTGNSSITGFIDAFTSSATPTAVISGSPGDMVSLLVVESSLEDLGPGYVPSSVFEANKAQEVTAELDGIIPADGTLELPVNLTDNASGEVYHLVAVKVNADGSTCNTSEVWRLRIGAAPTPMALFEITPGQGLDATTFGGSDKFIITNQSMGGVEITSILVDFRTGILPDMVFDPTGAGGDSGAQCFNPGPTANGVGLLPFGDNCSDPFGFPHFGGFDAISLEFDDFNPGESFSWSVDVDPNSLMGVDVTGAAGAVSGLELVGATITITFSDGSVVVSNLFEDGSNGGGQTLSPTNADAPTLEFVDVVGTEALVDDLNQTAHIIGGAANAGNYYALLQLDGRLLVPNGFTPFNVPDPTFYANEVMARVLYTGQLNATTGEAFVPLTLLQTVGAGGTVNGGKNHFMVVVSPDPYAPDQKVSGTSNRVVLVFDPNLPVELLGFRGQLQHPHVKLDWETASELNNDRFEIERSLDGFSFDYIGEVAGIGQSDISNFYDYLDRQAALLPTEELFYRLRQVDFDGSFNYSPIIRIELEDKGPEYLLYTVDPGRNFRIEETTGEGIRELELYTISGQSLGRYSYDNARMVDIPTATLPPGTYLIVIDDQHHERIVLTR